MLLQNRPRLLGKWREEIKETTLLIEVDGNVTLRIDKNMVVADTSDLQQQQQK